jgi:hypothetical protein
VDNPWTTRGQPAELLYWDVERLLRHGTPILRPGTPIPGHGLQNQKNSPNSCWMDFDLTSVGLFVPQISVSPTHLKLFVKNQSLEGLSAYTRKP